MAKKSRRARNTPRLSSAQLAGASTLSPLPRTDGAAPRQGGERVGRGLVREDYSHVLSDLKRIGTIAGALLLIMVVLSFVLPLIIR
jgi:hypothetical protein